MSKSKDGDKRFKAYDQIDTREYARVEVQLPCRLTFPTIWSGSLGGYTYDLHRNGVSVTCRIKPGRELPPVGETATVHIELPANQNFPPKYMRCDTTLVKIEEIGERDFQFAMHIQSMDFQDISAVVGALPELDSEPCGYVM